MTHVRQKFDLPERQACRYLDQPRSTQRRTLVVPDDEEALAAAIIRLARRYGRYGYRRITAMLKAEGWLVNHKRVERIWRREGLKVPKKQPKRGRLWFNDGSCIRLRSLRPNHVWSYDFVMERTGPFASSMICRTCVRLVPVYLTETPPSPINFFQSYCFNRAARRLYKRCAIVTASLT